MRIAISGLDNDCVEKLKIQDKRVFNLLQIEEYEFLGGIPKKITHIDFKKIFAVKDTDVLSEPEIEDFKIHVLTTNALLGNSGEDAVFQNGFRIKYFDKLLEHCQKKNKKLVVIYDEIHDSIVNFKEEFIFSLWKYQDIIYKNFIISATFNEASKEVIKYLSEFTDQKIKIIESDRVIFPSKQGKLHLILNDYKKLYQLDHLTSLINQCVKNNHNFDIISYSKVLIKNLVRQTELWGIYDKLNFCYNEDVDLEDIANKRFTNEKINLGTNFSTGANIEKKDHIYIIILPKRTSIEFFNNKGIFTSGYNALIQTVARQRIPGNIFLYMPTPYNLSKNSLPFNEFLTDQVAIFLEKFGKNESKINYSNLNNQNNILTEVFSNLLQKNNLAKQNILRKNREGMNSLNYFSKERFILSKGEKYLSRDYFKGDISTFAFFFSITNQFLNCKLSSISYNKIIELDEDDFLENVSLLYHDYAEQIVIDDMDFDAGITFGLERNKDYYSEYSILKNILENNDINRIKIGNKTATYSQLISVKRYLLFKVITKGLENQEINLNTEYTNTLLSKLYLRACLNFIQ